MKTVVILTKRLEEELNFKFKSPSINGCPIEGPFLKDLIATTDYIRLGVAKLSRCIDGDVEYIIWGLTDEVTHVWVNTNQYFQLIQPKDQNIVFITSQSEMVKAMEETMDIVAKNTHKEYASRLEHLTPTLDKEL